MQEYNQVINRNGLQRSHCRKNSTKLCRSNRYEGIFEKTKSLL